EHCAVDANAKREQTVNAKRNLVFIKLYLLIGLSNIYATHEGFRSRLIVNAC
ncbi:MAG: hypothetical protein ACI898_001545, partial [Flavobacteriales bacterium]